MKTFNKVLIFLVATVLVAAEESTYATCDEENSDDVVAVIHATVDRLMELRHPSWGWTNTPEVVLGLQLSAQKQFFARDQAIEQMVTEVNSEIDSMNIGKLALYVLAATSSCQNPHNFAGENLVNILEKRSREQFEYGGSRRQIVPFDRYYRFGLALGALCVNNRPTSKWIVRRVLRGQKPDGSFGDGVDGAAQMLLALKCMASEKRNRYLTCKINTAIWKLKWFLRMNINTEGEDVWIGNKYSSPSSALGLMEADEESPDKWRCAAIMKSLAVNPQPLENEGAFSQRLPALAGNSYLDLKFTDWECETPVPVPSGYQPTCNPAESSTCNPGTVNPEPQTMIDVRLTIYTQSPPSVGGIPNANVTVSVQNGSTLYVAMVEARHYGLITFESETSSWGQYITSMQGVEANATAHEYWALINAATQQLLPKGVSSYVPEDGEQIDFRLKTW